MRTTTQAAGCTSVKCPAPACTLTRPTCPPVCPNVKAMEMARDVMYRDIHEAPQPAQGCLDGELVTQQPLYNGPAPIGPRTCPPGTRPIPKRLPGIKRDRSQSDAFLDTFDCQEQPWRSTVHDVGRHAFSYQKLWRPSVRPVSMPGNLASRRLEREHRRSYIPCAQSYGKLSEWKASVRYLGSSTLHCKSTDWVPSVKCAPLQAGGGDKSFRAQVTVNRGPTYTAGKETSQLDFHPSLRYVPEFYPQRRVWRPSRKNVCLKECPHQRSNFNHHHCNHVTDNTRQNAHKELRRKNKLYFKQHPAYNLFCSLPHDEPPCCPPRVDKQGQLFPHTGDKPISWTVKSNPLQDTERDKRVRRHIPAAHVTHFEKLCTVVSSKTQEYKPLRTQLRDVQHRNPISGPLASGYKLLPRLRVMLPKPMAPYGKYNEDIVDGRFHKYEIEARHMYVKIESRDWSAWGWQGFMWHGNTIF